MPTLEELYQHKRFCEEQGYEVSPKLLQDIEQKELECLSITPDWAINTFPVRTEVDEYTGKFTVLVEYDNNVMVGASVRKNFSAQENGDYYVDAREQYPGLLEDNPSSAVQEPPTAAPAVSGPTRSKSKSIGFTVHFADGKVIDAPNAISVMIGALQYMGLDRVSKWHDITFKGFPLVGKEKRIIPPGHGIRQKQVDGWWVYVNMTNIRKIACLKGVAKMLGIDIEIKPKTDHGLFEEIEELELPQEKEKGSRQTYILNNSYPLSKNRVVYQAVKQVLKDIPDITYKDLEDIFPHEIQGGYGVIETLDQIEERIGKGQDARKRYFLAPSKILETSDGVRFAVCTQWDYRNFPRISDIITDFLGYKLEEV